MNLQEMSVDQIKVYVYDLIVQSNLITSQIREAEIELGRKSISNQSGCCGGQSSCSQPSGPTFSE